jgi:hypothetical protein
VASFFERGSVYATDATLALRGLHISEIPAKKIITTKNVACLLTAGTIVALEYKFLI